MLLKESKTQRRRVTAHEHHQTSSVCTLTWCSILDLMFLKVFSNMNNSVILWSFLQPVGFNVFRVGGELVLHTVRSEMILYDPGSTKQEGHRLLYGSCLCLLCSCSGRWEWAKYLWLHLSREVCQDSCLLSESNPDSFSQSDAGQVWE